MIIDATFWVAISFFIFLGGLIYLKVPQKINISLTNQISEIKKELAEAEKLKIESKNLLSDHESKIDKSKKETQEIINVAKKDSEKNILEKTKKFHQLIENKKKNTEQKIAQMKEKAIKDIKHTSVKISVEAVEHLIKNSIESIQEKSQKNGEFTKNIDIEILNNNDYITANITDSGTGFPKENIKNIIKPYFTTKPSGSGLGLSIVNKIINDHNGSIKFNSKNNGAKVEITLPKN